jgi:hypothetical protein
MSATCSHNRDDDKIKADIEKYGLSVIMVPGTDYLPAFAYSIGLWRNYQHPEVICFGMTVKTLGALINDVADLVKAGQTMEINKDYDDFLQNCPMQFVTVDHASYKDYFGTALDIYDSDDFPALQLVWPDRNHQFPWHTDFDKAFEHDQPLLDRNAHNSLLLPPNNGLMIANPSFMSFTIPMATGSFLPTTNTPLIILKW